MPGPRVRVAVTRISKFKDSWVVLDLASKKPYTEVRMAGLM